ncbi:MAG: SLC26A/SulP transporter family protein [Burkholderiaceae bacterium]|nr:SLC26A/SulP transporter family protein [Burkholderiaceae bacterium]
MRSLAAWRPPFFVALEGAGFAVPVAVGAVALLFSRIGGDFLMPGLLAALAGMALMHLATARAVRRMVYAARVLEVTMMLGFLEGFILKMPGWGLADTPAHRLMLVMAVSVGAALLLPLAYALRLQRFARMIPSPVFAGFNCALGVTLFVSQGAVLLQSRAADGIWFALVAFTVLAAAIATQIWATRWAPGTLGIAVGSALAAVLALAGAHTLSPVMAGHVVLALPVGMVPWADVWAPGVATGLLLSDVFLSSATLAVLVFLNSVVNEETVTQMDGAQPRPHDWVAPSVARLLACAGGAPVLTPTIGATRAAVRVGTLDARAMGLVAALALAVLASGLLAWVPLAAICGLLLYDGWTAFDRPALRLARRWARRRPMAMTDKEDLATIGLVIASAVAFDMVIGVLVGIFAGLLLYAWRNGRRLARSVDTGATVRSNCARSAAESAALAEHGDRIRLVVLEGALFFGAAGGLKGLLLEQCGAGRSVVVDWSHVVNADSTVARAVVQVTRDAAALGTAMSFCGLDATAPQVGETLTSAGLDLPEFPDVDRALEWAENRLLQDVLRPATPDGTALQDALTLLSGLSAQHREALEPLMEQRFFRAGDTVFEAGQRDSELMVILQGSVDILVAPSASTPSARADGRNVRLARLRRGALLGELSFLDTTARAATAVATEDLLLGVLSRERFDAFARQWPEAGRHVLANLALDLAFRLRRTNHLAVSHLR